MKRVLAALLCLLYHSCDGLCSDRTAVLYDGSQRTELRSSDYVNVYFDGATLVAANAGEVLRRDPANGSVIRHNKLKGLWRGLVSLATSRRPGGSTNGDAAAEKFCREAAAAASAAGGAR